MKAPLVLTAALAGGALLVASTLDRPAEARPAPQGDALFEIEVTNLTAAQGFTPMLVSSHDSSVKLFKPGGPATTELARLAEDGMTGPLASLLLSMPGVLQARAAASPLPPGASTTLRVRAVGPHDHVSMASMLVPTDDTFVALNGVRGPEAGEELVLCLPAWDAGSEVNDELCASLPSGAVFEECNGPGGGGAPQNGEGYVHISRGIRGVGDLDAAERDWKNPVARVVIRRL